MDVTEINGHGLDFAEIIERYGFGTTPQLAEKRRLTAYATAFILKHYPRYSFIRETGQWR